MKTSALTALLLSVAFTIMGARPAAAQADLVISAPPTLFVTPRAVLSGGRVTVSAWRVTNRGAAASNTFSNGFYLSTDATITAADVRLTGNGNSGLAPGASFDWGASTLTIPAGTPSGHYFIGILVDELNGTPEGANEGNNFKSTELTVGGGEQSYEYVVKVSVAEDGYLRINVKGNFATIHGCRERWFARTKYTLTDERTRAQMSIAMTSFVTRRSVFISTDGCTDDGYPILTGIQIQQDS